MHVVIGKGPVGAATAALLAERGERVRVASRTPGANEGGIEHVRADAADAQSLAAACRDAEVIYNCASPAYHRWAADWPPLGRAVLSAAQASGAVLVTVSNLYGYGPVDGPITESMPLAATGPKGRTRAEMWRQALAAHDAGLVRVTEARASDYFGPGVTATGHLAARMMPRLLKGRGVRVLGNPDAVHSWTFVPDIAAALVRLGSTERAWGRAWHVPTADPFSQRDAVRQLCEIAGTPPSRVSTTPWALLRALGAVAPPLRGMEEIRYQFDDPFQIDSTDYTTVFGEHSTPAHEALAATVRWWQEHLAAASMAGSVSARPA